MFEVVGTVNSFANLQHMKKNADYKKKTGVSLDDLRKQADQIAKQTDSLVEKMLKAQKTDKDEAAKQRVASIKNKLLAGKKLSQTEIDYLRDRDPKLYKKAKAADEARTELQAALKRAKTKQEARMALTQAMVKASSEAMAELSAAKGAAGANAVAPAGNSSVDQNFSDSNMNLNAEATSETSGNALIGTTSENVSEQNSETLLAKNISETNSEIEATNEEIKTDSENISETDENNSEIDQNSESNPVENSSDDKNAQEDILEKFLMIVAALEDEFINFMNTDHAKKLPEGPVPRKEIRVPNRTIHDMISIYKLQMNFSK